jgi:hypothetical protein
MYFILYAQIFCTENEDNYIIVFYLTALVHDREISWSSISFSDIDGHSTSKVRNDGVRW